MSKAASLAEELLKEYHEKISDFTIVPSTGGVFEVTLDNKLIFSKKELNRFPEPEEVKNLLANTLQA